MGVRKDEKKNGKWIAEFYKDGKRIRCWFDTKAEDWYQLHGRGIKSGEHVFNSLTRLDILFHFLLV